MPRVLDQWASPKISRRPSLKLVAAVQARIGHGDPLKLGALFLSGVLRVFPQHVPRTGDPVGAFGGRSWRSIGRPSSPVHVSRSPGLTCGHRLQACRRTRSRASVAHRTTWNRSAQRTPVGTLFRPPWWRTMAPSADTWVIPVQRCGPRKKRKRVCGSPCHVPARPRPGVR